MWFLIDFFAYKRVPCMQAIYFGQTLDFVKHDDFTKYTCKRLEIVLAQILKCGLLLLFARWEIWQTVICFVCKPQKRFHLFECREWIVIVWQAYLYAK